MKILHLSSYDITGGAARAAYGLHEGLRQAGVDSQMAVINKTSNDSSVHYLPRVDRRNRIHRAVEDRVWRVINGRRFRDGPPGVGICDNRSPFRPVDLEGLPKPDIYHLHWVGEFLDWPTMLPWLLDRAPLFWTLHDMNPMLGIWSYPPLGDVPASVGRWNETVRESKQRLWAKVPVDGITFVGPSQWMSAEASNSLWLSRFPVTCIPYGVKSAAYYPVEKRSARRALGVDETAFVVGVIAQNLAQKRKGMAIAVEALRQCIGTIPNLVLLTVGAGAQASEGFDAIHLGSVESDQFIRAFYSCLDLFLCPSLQDNLPNTILEALSCGIPVVAFDTGGIPDMVRPGETGWLVRPVGDVSALASTITEAASDSSVCARIGVRARQIAKEEYTLERQANAYLAAYAVVLQRPASG